MENSLFHRTYNPDVLSCIANLSNDEVFTPPELANKMLDMLPQELFENPDTTFLDPCCKSGVFLREIAKRLLKGLERQIPDLERRVEHIFSKQLYGIAITELTGMLSRRSLYCSKFPSGEYSVFQFPSDKPQGNVIFRRILHTWQNGKCIYCGASQSEYDRGSELETHAYQFIHNIDLKKLFNMKFDVIIGNPPYQMSDGGGTGTGSAIPIYNLFVEQAKKLTPRFLCMIIPARWYAGGRGLDRFRDDMLKENRISKLLDHPDSNDCFNGVDISGGICIFLWDRDYIGKCSVMTINNGKIQSEKKRFLLEKGCDTFIRYNEAISILEKVKGFGEATIDSIISSSTPFGLRSYVRGENTPFDKSVILYTSQGRSYIGQDAISKNRVWVDLYKVFLCKAYGERISENYWVTGKPFLGEPNSCCTETYLVFGTYEDSNQALNMISYIKTRFFRFLTLLKKNTQNSSSNTYSFVPIQDFSKPWTDEELYAKYSLDDAEIAFIESMIRPME